MRNAAAAKQNCSNFAAEEYQTMNIPVPEDFSRSLPQIVGNDAAAFLSALNGEPSLSVHINPEKYGKAGLSVPDSAEKVAWASNGYYLKSRPRFTFDPLLHAGAYYVEEPSSMFVEQALRRVVKEIPVNRALDLCAAPGGKSVLIRSTMHGGLLVANEPIAKRAAVLAENVAKWGNPDVAVTSNFPKAFAKLQGFFDVIAADVPCSGEGMFRKDEVAREEWSLENVENCIARQREILRDVWEALREGGFLIYSTCTFNQGEDESNVEWICNELGAQPVAIETCENWNISGDTSGRALPVYHFFPYKAKGEGFFLALLRKNGEYRNADRKRKNKAASLQNAKPDSFKDWLCGADDFGFYRNDDGVFALRKQFADDYALLSQNLNVIAAGVQVCAEKNSRHSAPNRKQKPQYIPAPQLAMSCAFNKEVFPTVELGYADAVKYLRGESVASPANVSKGWVAVVYRNLTLGFANNVGMRLNNSYPAPWRIRSTYAPNEAPLLEF